MEQYKAMIHDILNNGVSREYRNGNRISVFGKQLMFDISKGLPLVTIKKTNYRAAFDEMMFFISGHTNIKHLRYPNTWKQWSLQQDDLDNVDMEYPSGYPGDIGSVYGREYRYASNSGVLVRKKYAGNPYPAVAPDMKERLKKDHGDWYYGHEEEILTEHASKCVDQLWELVIGLRINPTSTRHRIAVYSPEYIPDESLSPQENIMRGKASLTACNAFQQYTTVPYGDTYKLSLHITLCSSDFLVGAGYNIVQFAMLLSIIAKEVNMIPDRLYINIGDAHIYENQVSALYESGLLDREPRPLPTLLIAPEASIWDLKHDDFRVVNYSHHPFVKFPVST